MRFSRRGRFVVALVALAAITLAACGDDDKDGSSSPTTDPTTAPTTAPGDNTTSSSGPAPTYPPVKPGEGADAEGNISDALIAGRFVAQQVGTLKDGATNLDEFKGVVERQYPDVDLVDADVAATPTAISGVVTAYDPNAAPSATNRKILAFAVMDKAEKCVGVVFHGAPEITGDIKTLVSFINAPIPACNAKEAAEWARGRIPH